MIHNAKKQRANNFHFSSFPQTPIACVGPSVHTQLTPPPQPFHIFSPTCTDTDYNCDVTFGLCHSSKGYINHYSHQTFSKFRTVNSFTRSWAAPVSICIYTHLPIPGTNHTHKNKTHYMYYVIKL